MNHADILYHEHKINRKPMSIHDRAAQFAPFAALTGYDEEIDEAARLTSERLPMDEDRQNYLDMCIARLQDEGGDVTVTYFVPDEMKDGGRYITVSGEFKRISEFENFMQLVSSEKIPLDEVYDIRFENT